MHDRPRLRPARPVAAALVAVVAAACSLTACSDDAESITAAPGGTDAACTSLVQRLPDTVLDAGRRAVDAAGAAAWGDPAIVLRCGASTWGPTAAPCLTVDGVDWVLADDGDPIRFVTFGTRPSVELTVPGDYDRTSAPGALSSLAVAVRGLPVTRRCS